MSTVKRNCSLFYHSLSYGLHLKCWGNCLTVAEVDNHLLCRWVCVRSWITAGRAWSFRLLHTFWVRCCLWPQSNSKEVCQIRFLKSHSVFLSHWDLQEVTCWPHMQHVASPSNTNMCYYSYQPEKLAFKESLRHSALIAAQNESNSLSMRSTSFFLSLQPRWYIPPYTPETLMN